MVRDLNLREFDADCNDRPPEVLQIGEVARLAEALTGVRRTTVYDLAQWRHHGRLVARQLDEANVVIRADFDYRTSCCTSARAPSACRAGTPST